MTEYDEDIKSLKLAIDLFTFAAGQDSWKRPVAFTFGDAITNQFMPKGAGKVTLFLIKYGSIWKTWW